MQDLQTFFQSTLLDWSQLTIANPFYAAALVTAAGLFFGVLYTIKSFLLQRKVAAAEAARLQIADRLAAAQQRTVAVAGQLSERQKQAAEIVQILKLRLDLIEQVPGSKGVSAADDIWPQLSAITNKLVAKLQAEQENAAKLDQAYQTETTKTAEKDMLLIALQRQLDDKLRQIEDMEQQIEQITQLHATESARVAELEQQRLDWLGTKQQLAGLEAKLLEKQADLKRLQRESEEKLKAASLITPPAVPLPEVIEKITDSVQTKTDGALASEMALSDFSDDLITPLPEENIWGLESPLTNSGIESGDEAVPVETNEPVMAKTDQHEAESEGQALSVFAQNSFGKIKTLFGRTKVDPSVDHEAIAAKGDALQFEPPETLNEESAPPNPLQNQFAKMKGLLGMTKPEASAEPDQDALAAPASEPVSEDTEKPSLSSGVAKEQFGKIKNLFGLRK